ncbi:unnamed protein product, partial [Allacma fusca]
MLLKSFLVLLLNIQYSLSSVPTDRININGVIAKQKHCSIKFLQITTPIDYSEIAVPFVLQAYPKQHIYLRVISRRYLTCVISVVLSVHSDSLNENVFIPLSWFKDNWESKQYNITVWVGEVLNNQRVRSDMVLILRQNSSRTIFSDRLLVNIWEESPGVPIFTIFPAISKYQDLFSGCYNFISSGQVGWEDFECSAPKCISKMVTTLNAVTNHGKTLLWEKKTPGWKFHWKNIHGSPFQRTYPRRLKDAAFEFLVEIIDKNATKEFYGKESRSIELFSGTDLLTEYIDKPVHFQPFPVS